MKQPIIIGAKPDDFDLNKKIRENETKEMVENLRKHTEKISRVTLAIEKILIKEDCRMNDWMEVVEKFNDRNSYVMPRLKVKEVKELHDKFTKS